jgi:hypothetical protein
MYQSDDKNEKLLGAGKEEEMRGVVDSEAGHAKNDTDLTEVYSTAITEASDAKDFPLNTEALTTEQRLPVEQLIARIYAIQKAKIAKDFAKELQLKTDLYDFMKKHPDYHKNLCNYMWWAVKTDVIFAAFVSYQLLNLSEDVPTKALRVLFWIFCNGIGVLGNTYSDVKLVDYKDQTNESLEFIFSFYRMASVEFSANAAMMAIFLTSSSALALTDLDGPVFVASLANYKLKGWELAVAGAPLVLMAISYYFGWIIKVMADVCQENFQYCLDTIGEGKSPVNAKSFKWLFSSVMFILWNVLTRSAAGYTLPIFQLEGQDRLDINAPASITAFAWISCLCTAIVAFASRWPRTSRYPAVHPHTDWHESLMDFMSTTFKTVHPKHDVNSFLKGFLRKVLLRSFTLADCCFLLSKITDLTGDQDLNAGISYGIMATVFGLSAWNETATLNELPTVVGFHNLAESVAEQVKQAFVVDMHSDDKTSTKNKAILKEFYSQYLPTSSDVDAPTVSASKDKMAECTGMKFNSAVSKSRQYLCRWPFNFVFVYFFLRKMLPDTISNLEISVFSLAVTFLVSDNEEGFVLDSLDKVSAAEGKRHAVARQAVEVGGETNSPMQALQKGMVGFFGGQPEGGDKVKPVTVSSCVV